MSLHTKMAIGFAVGIAAGVLANLTAADADWLGGLIRYVTDPVGQVFLRLLFMLVVPLVFSALVLGVVEIGDPRSLGRIGGRTLVFILVVTTIAVSIGLVAVNLLQPGQGLPPDLADELIAGSSERVADIASKGSAVSGIDLLINIVPRNPLASAVNGDLIGVMFFALMFGIGATVVASAGTRSFVGAVQGVYDICLKLIGWIIQLAPYAVACLLFGITAKLGFDVLVQLARYVGTVVLALAIHFFVVFPLLVRVFGGMSPLKFFKGAQPAILTAFSTSSSSATLPTTLECAEHRLGVPRPVARFVCTLGATANMNGTALFEGVTVPRPVLRRRTELRAADQHPRALHLRRDRCRRRARRLAAGDRDDPRDVRHPARRHRPDPGRRPLPRHVPYHGQCRRRSGGLGGGGARRPAAARGVGLRGTGRAGRRPQRGLSPCRTATSPACCRPGAAATAPRSIACCPRSTGC